MGNSNPCFSHRAAEVQALNSQCKVSSSIASHSLSHCLTLALGDNSKFKGHTRPLSP